MRFPVGFLPHMTLHCAALRASWLAGWLAGFPARRSASCMRSMESLKSRLWHAVGIALPPFPPSLSRSLPTYPPLILTLHRPPPPPRPAPPHRLSLPLPPNRHTPPIHIHAPPVFAPAVRLTNRPSTTSTAGRCAPERFVRGPARTTRLHTLGDREPFDS